MYDKQLKVIKDNNRIDKWLPIILLSLSCIIIFLSEKQDGGAIEGSLFGQTSAHGILLSKNLVNDESPFFMFSSREFKDGKVTYDAYNRFPVFPFLLTGLIIQPFESNAKLQIYIARQLMNLFFFLSILVAFKLVKELLKNKFLALSVVLISFSSYYMLTYNNMIFNDIPALLGFVLALYAVVMASKKRLSTRQLLFFSILPVSLGWQPYAVFLTWLLIDTIELLSEKKKLIKEKVSVFIRSQSLVVTVIAVICGILILGLELLNEWRIVGGSFVNIPSISSGLWRSGLVSAEGHTSLTWTFDWWTYLPAQAHSIAVMIIPFWQVLDIEPGFKTSVFLVVTLIIYSFIRYTINRSSLNKIHIVLILSGLIWTLPMRHFVALHDFQSIFYVGFVISLYLMILSHFNVFNLKLFSVIVTLVFLISVTLSSHYKSSNKGLISTNFESIYEKLPVNSKVFFDGKRIGRTGFSRYAIDLYLSNGTYTSLENADYVITKNENFNGEKLTSNTDYNLFKITDKIKEAK